MSREVAIRYYFFCRCTIHALRIFMGTIFVLFLAAFQAGLSKENPRLDVAFGLSFPEIHAMAMFTELISVLAILVCTHHVLHMKKNESFFPHGEELERAVMLGTMRRLMWLLIGGICCMHMTQAPAIHLRQFMFGDTVLGDVEFSFVFRVIEPMFGFAVIGYTMLIAFIHLKYFEHESYHVMEFPTTS